jgi:hypothetical protein
MANINAKPCRLLRAALSASLALCAASVVAAAQSDGVIENAQPGALVTLDSGYFNSPSAELNISPAASQAQLLLADNPEYDSDSGVLLRETVNPGTVRVYMYQVISGNPGKVVSIVLSNPASTAMNVKFARCARTGPSTDYNHVAQKVLYAFMNSSGNCANITVPANGKAVLDPALEKVTVSGDQLTHGIYEFSVDQAATISVIAHDSGQSSVDVIDSLPVLARNENGSGRGLFPTTNFTVAAKAFSTANGAQQLIMADGKTDPWISGHDTLAGLDSVQDVGNYGAMYRVSLPYSTPDGRGFALALSNPTGASDVCRYMATAVTVNGTAVMAPSSGSEMLSAPPQAIILAKIPALAQGASGTLDILFSPPGAACLPAPVMLIPYK